MTAKMVTMHVDVTFDTGITDAEAVSNALDRLMETVLSTSGIVDNYGEVQVGAFIPPIDHADTVAHLVVRATELKLVPEDLDELVYKTSDEIACDVNNNGPDDQIEYLLTHGWREDGIDAALAKVAKDKDS